MALPLTERYRVVSAAACPLLDAWPPDALTSWHQLAGDLGRSLRGRDLEEVIGVGHSLGAVTTLLAAAADPALFRAVVLVDPVLLSGASTLLWRIMTLLGLRRLLPIARGARRRRDRWPSREAVASSWSAARVFASWDPGVLEDYLAAGVIDSPSGGVELSYPKAWEARVYETAPASVWAALERLEVPVALIQGDRTDPFLRPAAERARRVLGRENVVIVPGTTHFVPMERPDEVARLILDLVD